MLEALALECTRGERRLFSNLGFSLNSGGLLRVAGANGSGKTSLLRILCGLLQPTGGEVRWEGRDIRALAEDYRGRLVYLGHLNAVKDDLSVEENLRIACRIAGLAAPQKDVVDAIRTVDLAGYEPVPARALSQGQKRRVALARLALSAAAPLWVLDEPFTALDARGIETVESLIEAQRARGNLVVLTSHQETALVSNASLKIELGESAGGRCSM